MWTCYTAPHLDPKKLSKRKEQFMPLPSDKKEISGVSETMKQLFLNEYKKWQESVN